jgi:transcriptional regulator with XRE-family HTH domain
VKSLTPLYQLLHIRRARGLSQAQLGHAAGFNQQYISDLERGLRPFDAAHVERLAAALHVDADALTANTLTICTSPSGVIAVKAN